MRRCGHPYKTPYKPHKPHKVLSYQHGYHAGNHADVLKHMVLLAITQHLREKPAPITYVDTHAGAGSYSLASAQAEKTGESQGGIEKLYDLCDTIANPPPLLKQYLDMVALFNPTGQRTVYPGSPLMLLAALRTREGIADTLKVFERHPTERRLLESNLLHHAPAPVQGQRVRPVLIQGADGFTGLPALMPPANRRAFVLIDPSYELKTDYKAVLDALRPCLLKFPTGTYAVWYPLLQRVEAKQLLPRLKSLASATKSVQYLNVTLTVSSPQPDGFGLWGSGMFVFNPPWTLAAQLKQALPAVKTALATDGRAQWVVEQG